MFALGGGKSKKTYANHAKKTSTLFRFAAFRQSITIVFAFLDTRISGVLFLLVAIMWIVPDKNIERLMEQQQHDGARIPE